MSAQAKSTGIEPTGSSAATPDTTGPIKRSSSFFSKSPPPPSSDEKAIAKFTQDDRHFSMIRNLHMADFITLLNGTCGFLSILSSVTYAITIATGSPDVSKIHRALCLVPLGLFFDFMDGRVARLRKKSSLMGQELDSLADLVSFGVAPGTAAYTLGFNTSVDVAALTVFVLCGLTRLARFNVTVSLIPKDVTGKSKYFEGTPIPTTLVLVGLLYTFTLLGKVHTELPFGTVLQDTPFEFHPLVGLFLASGSAMISKSLKIPKI